MDESTYKLLNVAGSWLAGVGSLLAVITSLWLARRSGILRLGVKASHVQVVTPGMSEAPDYVQVRVVNKGLRPAKVTSVGWQIGLFKKVHLIQMFGDVNSDSLPKMLNEGEEACLLVKLRDKSDDEDWGVRFARKVLLPHYKLNLKNMKVVVYTSVGQVFRNKIDKSLKKTLLEASKACITRK